MTQLTLTKLADELGLTKGRVSQMVGEGKLDGCYEGQGRARRFDLGLCAKALGKTIDPGQAMGNGAKTLEAIAKISNRPKAKKAVEPKKNQSGAVPLQPDDDDGYKLARTQKAVEEARRMRRINAEEEGTYVLASEVALQTKRLLGQEISEFESVLKDAARKIADEMGIDFKETRAILMKSWREHRGRRSKALETTKEETKPSDAELEEDI